MVKKYNLNYFSPSKFLWLALWLSMSILVNSLYLHEYIYINIHVPGAILGARQYASQIRFVLCVGHTYY